MTNHLTGTNRESAIAAYNAGNLVRAQELAERVLNEFPQDIVALNLAGACARGRGDPQAAEKYWTTATRIAPDRPELHSNLGVLLQELERFTQAEQHLCIAVELQSGFAPAHYNLGHLYRVMKRYQEAEDSFLTALHIDPHHVPSMVGLGNLFLEQREPSLSEQYFEQALRVAPQSTEAHYGLGMLCVETKEFARAEASFKKVLALNPNHYNARVNLGLLLLTIGNWREGWIHYETRLDPRVPALNPVLPSLSYPKWEGEPLNGKSILIWPEYGYGDEIQFARYAKSLKLMGAATVTLACKVPLVSLFRTSFDGICEIVCDAAAQQLAPHDFWVPAMSLPLYLATTLETIPNHLPYLTADSEKMKHWRSRLPPEGVKVGLAWKGSPQHRNDENRSLPGLFSLQPLWRSSGVAFVSLQKGEGENEAIQPPATQNIVHLGSDIRDFSDTAAIVAQLDLVICVDTSIAHLAGALGKECWVLLPYTRTDWRWLTSVNDSPWYPSVLRIFRQATPGNWTNCIAEVATALEHFLALMLQRKQSSIFSLKDRLCKFLN